MPQKNEKIAVVLFNLGGPDSPEAVEPFLFNLFNDRAIISLPNPFRYLVAKLISKRRGPTARKIYDQLGGSSPLFRNTEKQARALEKEMGKGKKLKVFIAMRYWHPFAGEAAFAVKDFNPDRIILLPLYPQFSTTTTASSYRDWKKAAKKAGLDQPHSLICCYPLEENFVQSYAGLISPILEKSIKKGPTRLLFSAHGLPEKIVKGGDPYAWQVEETVDKIMDILSGEKKFKNRKIDFSVCYQSRVGPLKWIGPSTEEEIQRAGLEKKRVVVIPVAFVSEHSETLVELDREYKDLAKEMKVPGYERIPAPGVDKDFIRSLKKLVTDAMERDGINSYRGKRICPEEFAECPCVTDRKTG